MYDDIKKLIIELGKILLDRDLTVESFGSISARIEENLMIITPKNIPFYTMKPSDLIVMDTTGNIIEGDNEPTLDFTTHVAVYNARRYINAIIIAQPTYATAFAVARKKIPMIMDETTMYTGGDIEVAEYAVPGTIDLANNIICIEGQESSPII